MSGNNPVLEQTLGTGVLCIRVCEEARRRRCCVQASSRMVGDSRLAWPDILVMCGYFLSVLGVGVWVSSTNFF
ncbi:hypothetical protein E2C01_059864 [Portunus trituberculatus]|uniref:Uncharacterized protein n=1 Tax=Portunus trituberculatus TaxID=210409 RepID=A0A5B7H8Y7_PORTR|nr:hypothetical protein [Portunus trituberculatus]